MNPINKNLEIITGSIERITFHSEETSFCVLRAKVKGKRELVTVVGKAAYINVGEYIECLGLWINSQEYGIQFKAENLVRNIYLWAIFSLQTPNVDYFMIHIWAHIVAHGLSPEA